MKSKLLWSLLLLVHCHLSWSQSYPTQRIEGKDTVVVMTKQQAQDINAVFRKNKLEMDEMRVQLLLCAQQDTLWANLTKEGSEQTIELLKSISYNQATIMSLEQQLRSAERKTRTTSVLSFAFFAAFISYLHFF